MASSHSPRLHTARPQCRRLLAALAGRPLGDQVADRRLAAEALVLARLAGEPLLIAECLLAAARHLTTLMQPGEALAGLREAASIFRANGLPAQETTCQVASARALYDLGHERQAAAMAQAALQAPALPGQQRVRALTLLFNACGRMGQLEVAHAFLHEQALPLARTLGDSPLLGHVLQQEGWLYARLANSLQNDALPLPAHRVLGDARSAANALARCLALLDEARGYLPEGPMRHALDVDLHYALGLQRRGPAAAEAPGQLLRLAQVLETVDPPLAASAHVARAMVLQDGGRFDEASQALPRALALAQAHGLQSLRRDVMYLQALTCEAMQDFAGAYAALKEHSRLSLSSAEGAPAPSAVAADGSDAAGLPAGESLPAHRLRALESPHLRRAQHWIDQRVGRPIQVPEVAQACGVSRRTLDEAFRVGQCTTVAQYIRRKQIEHAAEQLLHTDRPVREIANAVGYRSPTMFAREFRDRLGLTPSQWRGMSRQVVAVPDTA